MLSRILLTLSCLVFACLSQASAPPNQPLTRASSQQHFMVTLIPPQQAIMVNQMHSWQVRVTGADGRPVNRASFKVDGGMPQHNHGLPTQPQVTQALGHGTFLLEGVKFNMPGWWELTLSLDTEKIKDTVHFQILIELPATKQPASSAPKPGAK